MKNKTSSKWVVNWKTDRANSWNFEVSIFTCMENWILLVHVKFDDNENKYIATKTIHIAIKQQNMWCFFRLYNSYCLRLENCWRREINIDYHIFRCGKFSYCLANVSIGFLHSHWYRLKVNFSKLRLVAHVLIFRNVCRIQFHRFLMEILLLK